MSTVTAISTNISTLTNKSISLPPRRTNDLYLFLFLLSSIFFSSNLSKAHKYQKRRHYAAPKQPPREDNLLRKYGKETGKVCLEIYSGVIYPVKSALNLQFANFKHTCILQERCLKDMPDLSKNKETC